MQFGLLKCQQLKQTPITELKIYHNNYDLHIVNYFGLLKYCIMFTFEKIIRLTNPSTKSKWKHVNKIFTDKDMAFLSRVPNFIALSFGKW